jgi:hypothetical protein
LFKRTLSGKSQYSRRMVTLTLGTAGPPKRQIIELAFGDIGSAGYEFGRTPEEVNDALLR